MTTHGLPFVKGHGTENDFVVLPDLDAALGLDAAAIASICDRRAGIGADGILRVVRVGAAELAGLETGDAQWFMDYRNADGSIAEMCGNGARVFARYLVEAGLVEPGSFPIATRGGLRHVDCPRVGPVTVEMGQASFPELPQLTIRVGERSWSATGVHMPNPHAVVLVEDLTEAGDLLRAPVVEPAGAFPDGVNVEFVRVHSVEKISLRVHERGSGETRSCGTGVCAVVAAGQAAEWLHGDSVAVHVPGGELEVTRTAEGSMLLTGPAVLVAAGEWWGG